MNSQQENVFSNIWQGEVPPLELRRIRLQAGLSQQQMADSLGIERTELSHIERGNRTITLAILRKYAEAAGLGLIITMARTWPAEGGQV